MRTQPKHARLSEKIVSRPAYNPPVLHRELCQDQDGKALHGHYLSPLRRFERDALRA